MNLFRTLCVGAGLGLSGAGLSSCLSPPDFPTTPAIDFKEVQSVYTPRMNGEAAFNTLTLAVDYRDGDGDLGLGGDGAPASDEEAPYQRRINNRYNRDGHNYHIQALKLNRLTMRFEEFILSERGEFDGRFPRLTTNDTKAPLKGTLKYTLVLTPNSLPGGPFNSLAPGDELQFKISIKDRALQESNVVTTSTVVIGQ